MVQPYSLETESNAVPVDVVDRVLLLRQHPKHQERSAPSPMAEYIRTAMLPEMPIRLPSKFDGQNQDDQLLLANPRSV